MTDPSRVGLDLPNLTYYPYFLKYQTAITTFQKMGSSSLDEWDDPPEPQSLVGYGQPPLEIVSDDELKEVLP